MTYPRDIGAVDLMIGFPMRDKKAVYEYLMRGIHDEETKKDFTFPAEYMFKDVPDEDDEGADPIDDDVRRDGQVRRRARAVRARATTPARPRERYPGRVFFSLEVDPNDVMKARRSDPRRQGGARPQGGDVLPVGLLPAGARRRRARCTRSTRRASSSTSRSSSTPGSPGRGSRPTASTSSASTASATTSPSCAS